VATGAALAAQAASMLTELNRDRPVHRAEPADRPPAEAPAAAAQEPREAEPTPQPMVSRENMDTAMLLRELSSLGFGDDDERPATPPAGSTPRRVPPAVDRKKRKGLFGRS
jgi:hypothetical protein